MKISIIMRSQAGVPGRSGVPGGQIGMIQLARALPAHGHEVSLFVGGPRMAYFNGLSDIEPTFLRWPTWLDAAIAATPEPVRAAGARARRHRWLTAITTMPGFASADVIHVQGLEDAEALLANIDGPIVVTHWGRAGRWTPRGTGLAADRALTQRIARLRERVTLVAIGYAQARTLADAGLPPAAVIPPGLDLQHFAPGDRAQARRRLGLHPGDRIVLYVGRLAHDKNVETLLKAFANVHRRVPAAALRIVGDGPTKQDLQRLSARLGIDTAVTFVPIVPHHELRAHYQAADVTVVPSDFLETYCMVALEAIACGCPLVVTDQVPEIIHAFPSVPAVRPYDVNGLSGQIAAALRGALPAAEKTPIRDYGWSVIAGNYSDLYPAARRRSGITAHR